MSKNPKNRLRRSSRERKQLHESLNQNWLGQYGQEYVFSSSPASATRRRIVDDRSANAVSDERISRRSHSRRSRELVALNVQNDRFPHNAAPESEEEETFDIYSRVKRRRRVTSCTQRDGGVYGVEAESHEESNQSAPVVVIDHVTTTSSKTRLAPQQESSTNSTPKKSTAESSTDDEEERITRRYCLREQKTAPQRFEIVLPEPKKRHREENAKRESREFVRPAFHSPAHKRVKRDFMRRNHIRKLEHESSTSSDDDTPKKQAERNFESRKVKSLERARSRFLPLNVSPTAAKTGVFRERLRIGASCADLDPMSLDSKVGFNQIGGLCCHVNSLKEMILFPFLYPEVFDKFKITPPRGVLFYGPPGTGKTLVARALANECSKNDRQVAFFMRKGADCLSKWVGESERQLRLLFDQAYTMRPSIIFFDEIDGLAPVRSSRQDQIHSSIVSTLLALMDGLDQRGEVIVIGATNRLDALDPALRRPGRFDREMRFNLPDLNARKEIFQIHTKEWKPPLTDTMLDSLAAKSIGYCGADIKGLCTEAALISLRKRYPQIYSSDKKLLLDTESIEITLDDFSIAMQKLVPAVHRNIGPPTRPLSNVLSPLLSSLLSKILDQISVRFRSHLDSAAPDYFFNDFNKKKNVFSQRLLICGNGSEHGQTSHLSPAIIHSLDHLPVFSLAVPQIFSSSFRTAEEAVAEILSNASKSTPCVLYLPALDLWFHLIPESAWYSFVSILESWNNDVSILLLTTAHETFADLNEMIKKLFETENVVECQPPSDEMRKEFFDALIVDECLKAPIVKIKREEEILEFAPVEQAKPLSDKEVKAYEKKSASMLRQLRIFLREILNRLIRDRRFVIFSKPVDLELAPDYFEIVKEPMDLSKMAIKIDQHKYESVEEFLADIDLIQQNALEYNPDRDHTDKIIRHRACALRDIAYALIDEELDSEFETQCKTMKEFRNKIGINGVIEPPPAFINVVPGTGASPVDVFVSKSRCRSTVPKSKSPKSTNSKAASIWCKPKRRRPISAGAGAKAAANDIVQKYKNHARRQLAVVATTTGGSTVAGNKNGDEIQNAEDASSQIDEDDEHETDEKMEENSGPPSLESLPSILCDRERLEKLADIAVAKTQGWSVFRLEKIYASIIRAIDNYSDSFDRRSLVEDLTEIVQSKTEKSKKR